MAKNRDRWVLNVSACCTWGTLGMVDGMAWYSICFFSEYELDKGDTIGCLPVEHMPDAT